MIKGNKVFVLIVLLCNCICFPKIVWVYWNTGFEHAPLLYQLTLKNTQAQLKDGGWDIRIIDDKTIDKWLKVEEVDQFMKESQFRTFIQLRSDYIRMRLLIEHGGVWLDTGIVLLEDLSWLDHLHENPQAQGTSQDPTVLMFYFTIHGSMQSRKIDKDRSILVSPGFHNSFIACNPQSLLMIDWLKQMVIFSKGGLPTIAENLSFYGTRTGTLTLLDYYLMTYEALQVVVQRKQLELDSIAEVNNLAIDYYGIWGIGSIEGPFRLFLKQNTWWPKLNIQALTEYTEEELATKIGKPRYFIKLVHEHKQLLNGILEGQSSSNQPNKKMFLSRNFLPFSGRFKCLNSIYIVKQSIVDKYLLSRQEHKTLQVSDKDNITYLCRKTDLDWLLFFTGLAVLTALFYKWADSYHYQRFGRFRFVSQLDEERYQIIQEEEEATAPQQKTGILVTNTRLNEPNLNIKIQYFYTVLVVIFQLCILYFDFKLTRSNLLYIMVTSTFRILAILTGLIHFALVYTRQLGLWGVNIFRLYHLLWLVLDIIFCVVYERNWKFANEYDLYEDVASLVVNIKIYSYWLAIVLFTWLFLFMCVIEQNVFSNKHNQPRINSPRDQDNEPLSKATDRKKPTEQGIDT